MSQPAPRSWQVWRVVTASGVPEMKGHADLAAILPGGRAVQPGFPHRAADAGLEAPGIEVALDHVDALEPPGSGDVKRDDDVSADQRAIVEERAEAALESRTGTLERRADGARFDRPQTVDLFRDRDLDVAGDGLAPEEDARMRVGLCDGGLGATERGDDGLRGVRWHAGAKLVGKGRDPLLEGGDRSRRVLPDPRVLCAKLTLGLAEEHQMRLELSNLPIEALGRVPCPCGGGGFGGRGCVLRGGDRAQKEQGERESRSQSMHHGKPTTLLPAGVFNLVQAELMHRVNSRRIGTDACALPRCHPLVSGENGPSPIH